MDWLGNFLERAMMANITAREKMSIRITGELVPKLLFADDIIFTTS